MIDTILNLDDFLKVFAREGGCKDDLRICVEHKSSGEYFVRCKVILSVGIFNATGQPKKVLRCVVAERSFDYFSLTSKSETEEKRKYQEWVKKAYKRVEEKLGFKPIEGIWEWK